MNKDTFEIIKATLPALVMGIMVFVALKLYFNRVIGLFLNNESKRREFEIKKLNNDQFFLNKTQACERFAIYLERINPSSLVKRLQPTSNDVKLYTQMLTQIIDQEFEHNLAQQIYLQDNTYAAIKNAKNATKAMITKLSKDYDSVDNFRKTILINGAENEDETPSIIALKILKTEF